MARMNDRGQILLIGAITIAVTFLSLGIVLNGSLNTPAIASEASDDVTGTSLEEVRETVRQEATAYVQQANNQYASLSDPEDYVKDNVSTLGDSLESYYAKQDVALSIGGYTSVDVVPGQYVSGSLTSPSTTLIPTRTTEVRHFNIQSISLSGGTMIIVMGGETVEITSGQVTVVGRGSCSHGGRVEVTNATTNAGHCEPLEFVSELGEDYNFQIYSDSSFSGSATASFISQDTSFVLGTDRIYEVEVPVEYRTAAVEFVGRMDIAPGEP